MGLHHFQPARRSSGAPEIRNIQPTSAATLTLGEPVQRNSTDPELIEAHAGGTTVTGILGVAMAGVTSGTPDFDTVIPVAIANVDQEFLGQVYDVSESAVATAVVGTHEGVSFGMVESGGNWYVDEEDTTNVVLRVTKVLTDINCVLFKFLPSATELG